METNLLKYGDPPPPCEDLRLECVVTCVGFDDFLDVCLGVNHSHVDTLIVVTDHNDKKTQQVAAKHGCICVQSDLFKKNGRNFNKGAAINAGFSRFQYHGWRMHLDADILLPDSFRRILFNHTDLDRSCIYGADRTDVHGMDELKKVRRKRHEQPQFAWGFFIESFFDRALSPRYMDPLRGYVPIGYFQLWHASAQKAYPYSLGTASHDDVQFAEQWSRIHRRLLPNLTVGHLVQQAPKLAENWDGHRRQPRLKK
jgi:glycosyltransferase involved in cell wall biosynthesis